MVFAEVVQLKILCLVWRHFTEDLFLILKVSLLVCLCSKSIIYDELEIHNNKSKENWFNLPFRYEDFIQNTFHLLISIVKLVSFFESFLKTYLPQAFSLLLVRKFSLVSGAESFGATLNIFWKITPCNADILDLLHEIIWQ